MNVSDKDKYNSLCSKAKQAFKQGETGRAIILLQAAIRLSESSTMAKSLISEIYMQTNHLEKARDQLQELLVIDSDNEEYRKRLNGILKKINNSEENQEENSLSYNIHEDSEIMKIPVAQTTVTEDVGMLLGELGLSEVEKDGNASIEVDDLLVSIGVKQSKEEKEKEEEPDQNLVDLSGLLGLSGESDVELETPPGDQEQASDPEHPDEVPFSRDYQTAEKNSLEKSSDDIKPDDIKPDEKEKQPYGKPELSDLLGISADKTYEKIEHGITDKSETEQDKKQKEPPGNDVLSDLLKAVEKREKKKESDNKDIIREPENNTKN